MRKKNSEIITESLQEKIINAAYGDANIFDKIEVLWKASRDENVKALLDEYKKTAGAVHGIGEKDLPEYITEKVKNEIGYQYHFEKAASKSPLFRPAFSTKKLFPATAIGMILLAIISFFIFREPAYQIKYSKAEIELAQKQARESLEIVAKVFQKTELKIDFEISTKVSKQLNKGLSVVDNYVTGG